ncbi:hypothetical protein N0V90_006239 [Kalmusia sp. IMI 367209]|nr:hypothetical protein N0V90_006239 [Kalmusia sp. IMI 367209]
MSDIVTGKTFSEDTVAVLLMALGNTSISSAQYDMMSSLDGTKTASSFQHQFRSVLKKAKEFKARVDDGEKFEPVQPNKKRGMFFSSQPPFSGPKATPKATPKSRAKKNVPKAEPVVDGFEDGIDFSDDFVKTEYNADDDFV